MQRKKKLLTGFTFIFQKLNLLQGVSKLANSEFRAWSSKNTLFLKKNFVQYIAAFITTVNSYGAVPFLRKISKI
jgi:hypothetical protein